MPEVGRADRCGARLNGMGEFSEGCGDPMPRVDAGGEFVVSAAEVLDECVSGTDDVCRMQRVESSHRPQPSFQSSVVSFDGVVCLPLGDMAGDRQQLIKHSGVGRCPVGAHLTRARAVVQSAGEEPASGRQIHLLGDQDVDDLAVLVDRPVQIDPPPDRCARSR